MPGRYDVKARRAAETKRLAAYERGTGESTSKVDNAILGTLAGIMGTRGLGRVAGAARAGGASKAAGTSSSALSGASKSQKALTGGKTAQKALTGSKTTQKALTGGSGAPKGSLQWNSKTGAAPKPKPKEYYPPGASVKVSRTSRAQNLVDKAQPLVKPRPNSKSPLGGTRGY